jgi:CTP synthase
VIAMRTASTIYEVPLMLEDSGLGAYLVRHLGLPETAAELSEWRDLGPPPPVPEEDVTWALVGKYVDLRGLLHEHCRSRDARRTGPRHQGRDRVVNSETLTRRAGRELRKVSGVLVGPGFGPRGTEGKCSRPSSAAQHSRSRTSESATACTWRSSSSPARLRLRGGELQRDRPRDAAPGDRPDARPARRRDGRDDAARTLAVLPGARVARR